MKKTILIVLLIAVFTIGVNAKTSVFVGGGVDFTAFNAEGRYNIDKNWGFSGGFMKTLSEKVSTFTIYDYVVTKATNSSGIQETLFKYEILASVSYLLNSTESKFQVRILAGLEITDGNIPDYGTLLSYAHGAILSYSFGNKAPNLWAAGTMSVTNGYYDGKLRLGLVYPIPDFLGAIF